MKRELCPDCRSEGKWYCWFVNQVDQVISLADAKAAELPEGADLKPLGCIVFTTIANLRSLADYRSCPNRDYDPSYAGRSDI